MCSRRYVADLSAPAAAAARAPAPRVRAAATRRRPRSVPARWRASANGARQARPRPLRASLASATPALRAVATIVALRPPVAIAQRSPRTSVARDVRSATAASASPAAQRRRVRSGCRCARAVRASSRLAAGRARRRARRRPGPSATASPRDERDAALLPTTCAIARRRRRTPTSMREQRRRCARAHGATAARAPAAARRVPRSRLVANALPSAATDEAAAGTRAVPAPRCRRGLRRDGRLGDHAIEGFRERRDQPSARRSRRRRRAVALRRAARCCSAAGPASWSSSANAAAAATRSAGIGGKHDAHEPHAPMLRAPLRVRRRAGQVDGRPVTRAHEPLLPSNSAHGRPAGQALRAAGRAVRT